MIVEIDGPHHRATTRRADDANRDLQWRRCGIDVVRLTRARIASHLNIDNLDDIMATVDTTELRRIFHHQIAESGIPTPCVSSSRCCCHRPRWWLSRALSRLIRAPKRWVRSSGCRLSRPLVAA